MITEVNLVVNPDSGMLTILENGSPKLILELTRMEGLEILAGMSNTAGKVLDDRKSKADDVGDECDVDD